MAGKLLSPIKQNIDVNIINRCQLLDRQLPTDALFHLKFETFIVDWLRIKFGSE